jgi:hypothetical protein
MKPRRSNATKGRTSDQLGTLTQLVQPGIVPPARCKKKLGLPDLPKVLIAA